MFHSADNTIQSHQCIKHPFPSLKTQLKNPEVDIGILKSNENWNSAL